MLASQGKIHLCRHVLDVCQPSIGRSVVAESRFVGRGDVSQSGRLEFHIEFVGDVLSAKRLFKVVLQRIERTFQLDQRSPVLH